LCSWTFVLESERGQGLEEEPFVDQPRNMAAFPPWGHIDYRVHDVWLLAQLTPVPPDVQNDLFSVLAPLQIYQAVKYQNTFPSDTDVRARVRAGGDIAMTVLMFAATALPDLYNMATPFLLSTVPLRLRTNPLQLVENHPPKHWITRWRVIAGVKRHREGADAAGGGDGTQEGLWEATLLELPRRRRQRKDKAPPAPLEEGPRKKMRLGIDPLRMLKALFFSRHLKDQRSCFRSYG